MNNKPNVLLAFFLVMLALSGCANGSTERGNNVISTDPDCDLPCWYEIVPGKTNLVTATELLAESQIVDEVSISTTEPGLRFELISDRGRGSLSGENDLVEHITLNDLTNVSLEDVVDAFGEPEFVHNRFHQSLLCYETDFFYPQKGLYISGETCINVNEPESAKFADGLEPGSSVLVYLEMPIYSIIFLEAASDILEMNVPFNMHVMYETNLIHSWDGYKMYVSDSRTN